MKIIPKKNNTYLFHEPINWSIFKYINLIFIRLCQVRLTNTVKLVIHGDSTYTIKCPIFDKVSMYERLQLFTQFISILPLFQMFSHIHLYYNIFSLKCVVHTFLFDLCPHCIQIETISDLVH